MKLNLSSTWTKQKIQSLLLLTLIHSLSKTDAGSDFIDCLGDPPYSQVVKFASNIPNGEEFCCEWDSWNCIPVAVINPDCPFSSAVMAGQCSRLGQSMFCVTIGHGKNGKPSPGYLCGGILGDNPVTNITVGNCPNLDSVANALSISSTAPTFSWMCCDTNNCVVPASVKVDLQPHIKYLAHTNCNPNQWSFVCFKDNGGWGCTGNVSTNYDYFFSYLGTCSLQVVLPNSSPIETTTYTSEGKTITSLITKPTDSNPIFPNEPRNKPLDNSSLNRSDIIAIFFGILSSILATIAIYFAYLHYSKPNENSQSQQVLSTNQQQKNTSKNKSTEEIELKERQSRFLQTPYGIPSSSKK